MQQRFWNLHIFLLTRFAHPAYEHNSKHPEKQLISHATNTFCTFTSSTGPIASLTAQSKIIFDIKLALTTLAWIPDNLSQFIGRTLIPEIQCTLLQQHVQGLLRQIDNWSICSLEARICFWWIGSEYLIAVKETRLTWVRQRTTSQWRLSIPVQRHFFSWTHGTL